MQHAMINGENLEYSVQGSHDGDAVVLIHGGMFADMYVPLMSESSLVNNYRLVNYHRRGYAGSTSIGVPIKSVWVFSRKYGNYWGYNGKCS